MSDAPTRPLLYAAPRHSVCLSIARLPRVVVLPIGPSAAALPLLGAWGASSLPRPRGASRVHNPSWPPVGGDAIDTLPLLGASSAAGGDVGVTPPVLPRLDASSGDDDDAAAAGVPPPLPRLGASSGALCGAEGPPPLLPRLGASSAAMGDPDAATPPPPRGASSGADGDAGVPPLLPLLGAWSGDGDDAAGVPPPPLLPRLGASSGDDVWMATAEKLVRRSPASPPPPLGASSGDAL
jgi:hypothetical protein